MYNLRLYEINLRVWLKQNYPDKKLSDLPKDYFLYLKNKGINIVWFMGLWNTCPHIIKECCFTPELISAYKKALKDFKNEDVVGSPYAVEEYEINPIIGNWDDLLRFREMLNSIGLKLFLDFIPNHFNAGSKLLKTNPEIFLHTDEESFIRDPFTFFKTELNKDYIFAHGRDPLFPAWTDTVQINYFSQQAREFMQDNLLKISEAADGVRCDMAMLPLNNVFNNTWMGTLNKSSFKKPQNEFWEIAIKKVKQKYPNFIFLAEAYWDLEWDLQQLGFDYTYDKRLYDRLITKDIPGVKAHLNADKSYQLKSVRFIENHDEERAVTALGKERCLAAATVISTIQGMVLYHDGQFEGRRLKLPVQIGRLPDEKKSTFSDEYYDKLLEITKHDIFRKGEWKLLTTVPAAVNNDTCNYIFAWQWLYENEVRIVIINYLNNTAQCRIKLNLPSKFNKIYFTDLLSGNEYSRNMEELKEPGIFIELKGFHSHIFAAKIN